MLDPVEQYLLSSLDALRDISSPEQARQVRRDCVTIHESITVLVAHEPRQRALRLLYEYLDAASRDSVAYHTLGLDRERSEIENELLAFIDQCRRPPTRHDMFDLCATLDSLGERLARFDQPEHTPHLDRLYAYAGYRYRAAIEILSRAHDDTTARRW